LGATVASLGVLGAGIGLRQATAKEYNDETKCPGPDRDLSCGGKRVAVRKYEAMTIAGGAAAGVFAVLSIVFFVLDGRAKTDAAHAGAGCGPAFQAGALCQVRF
jgi:hypothetical protein